MIERYRSKLELDLDEAIEQPAPVSRIPLRLNRNFLNYPLARDARAAMFWRQDSRGDWWAALPTEKRIRLCLPVNTPISGRRPPTAFDMNVLFLTLAEIASAKSARVKFASFAAVLRDLEISAHSDNRRQLQAALVLWRRLSISYDECWYVPKQGGTTRQLPPPFKTVEYLGNRVLVTVDPIWVKLVRDRGYKQLVPLPLPAAAAAQNAVLMIMTSAGLNRDDDSPKYSRTRGTSSFARKCGLRLSHRRRRLISALNVAALWFADVAGSLKAVFGPTGFVPAGRLMFVYEMPRPRWRRSRKNRRIHPCKTDVCVLSKSWKSDDDIPTIKSVLGKKNLRKTTANAAPSRFAREGRRVVPSRRPADQETHFEESAEPDDNEGFADPYADR